MKEHNFDLTIIGSGPGGYVAAIRAAQLGFKTAIIERYPTLGGTCLNVGCIPSKALLDSSEHYHKAAKEFKDHGIEMTGLKLNMKQFISRKTEVVKGITQGVEFLMKKNKIQVFTGHGRFVDAHTVEILAEKGSGKATEIIKTTRVIIATGSKPATIPNVVLDKKRIISSTEALKLEKLPKKMLIIGAGVIGLEMGSVYARLGTEVEVIEYTGSALNGMDSALGKEITRVLKKTLGIKFYFNHKVTGAKATAKSVTVSAENEKGETITFTGDYCLVATGRKPYTDNLGLENTGLKTDERGRIPVNENLESEVEGIYAIGDVVRGAMLAHKASEEGVFVVEKIAGQHPHINYRAIPGVVYTWPEVASVGFTEDELKENGTPYKSGQFPVRALGRARASGDIDGFVKILAHKDTDEILGMHIISARAADMIMEGVTALGYRGAAEDFAIFSHAHPTYSEAIKEAAMAATENRAIHL